VIVDRVEELGRVRAAARDLAVEELALLVEDEDGVQREVADVGVLEAPFADHCELGVADHGERE
jgi:hypothetical protein